MAARLWRAYQRSMAARPLLTKMASAACLTGGGDLLCQCCIQRRAARQYDAARTGRFAALGGLYAAPVISAWFWTLERLVTGGPARLLPLKRVLVDQICFAPFVLSGFILILRGLEGNTPAQCWEKYRRDFVPIYLTGIKVWPAAQLVNFYLTPYHYRVVALQVVSLFWNTYLSWKTQRQRDSGGGDADTDTGQAEGAEERQPTPDGDLIAELPSPY